LGVGRIQGNASCQNNCSDYTGCRYSVPAYSTTFAYCGIDYNSGKTRSASVLTYGNNINLCTGATIANGGSG